MLKRSIAAAALAALLAAALTWLACSARAPGTAEQAPAAPAESPESMPSAPPAAVSTAAVSTAAVSTAVVPLTIMDIQGAGHRSPYEGRRVETRGVVVASSAEISFVQDAVGDGDERTSDGLCVLPTDGGGDGGDDGGAATPRFESFRAGAGQLVSLAGTVEELRRRPNDLTITCLRLEAAAVVDALVSPPEPVLLGPGGRPVPNRVADDDGLSLFEPEHDGIDFFEALEGMRVRVRQAQVVGATSRRGEVMVVAGDGVGASVMHPRGGLLRREGDDNPEALMLDGGFGVEPPVVDVGQKLDPIEAVLDYGWGAYRLRLLQAPSVAGSAAPPERTQLIGDDRRLTIATFNVLNLAATDGRSKLRKLAQIIVHGLGSPDLLAVQEIQDENGSVDDGTVTARRTYEVLVEAVVAAGGPRYDVRQLDPMDKADGGRPGGNIRVGYLFRPDRVEPLDAEAPTSASRQPTFERRHGRLRLQPSPARLEDPAFERDEARGWSGTRKPLVAQFRFRGRDFVVVNLHLRSKGGDDRVFGDRQPPVRHSETQRTAQARVVRRFVDQLLAADPDAWLVVLGDLNEHIGRPPVQAFDGALVNLLERVPEDERYTYVYRGQSQVLDHVLVSPAVAEHAAPEIDVVHTASDYAASRQASDHEPIVLRLRLPEGLAE